MRKIFILCIVLSGILSCQKEGEFSEPCEITVNARILTDSQDTKSPIEVTVPTADNPVTAAIWASTTSHRYEGTQSEEPGPDATFIDYHNSTCFTSGSKQLLDHQLFYPSNKKTVYFVGFCPRSSDGWTVVKDGKYNIARYEFDGKTDVMYASETSNSIEYSAMDLNLEFRHILTWLRFNVVADKNAIEAWGPVKKITIESNKEVYIDVEKDTCTFDGNDEVFPTYITKKGEYTDNVFSDQSIELTTSSQEVAYSLCAAVNAGSADNENEYTVTIETQYRPETTVTINLKNASGSNFSGLTEGRQFTVTLRFKLGDNITTSACVSEWKNGGIGVTPINE